MTIILPFIFSFLSFPVAAIFINCRNYPYYKKVYKSLPYRRYYRNRDQVYSASMLEPDDGFCWFTTRNDFQLDHAVYLHNNNVTHFDPIAYYWLRKYRKWFAKHVDVNQLPTY